LPKLFFPFFRRIYVVYKPAFLWSTEDNLVMIFDIRVVM
jgi:hypothetical protein